MKKIALAALAIVAVAAIVFWLLTLPQPVEADALAGMETGDAARGERVFWAAGCASCHAAKGAKGEDKLKLGGGHPLVTPAGTFVTPNISPDQATGIGAWSGADFANAVLRGVSPEGAHYYPSFPYASYAGMAVEDVADLWAYLKTLEPIDRANEAHELALPFRLRRGLGLWKTLFVDTDPVVAAADEGEIARGRYLVETLGHCGECHTPRTFLGFGGMDRDRWLAGGPAPEGKGRIPNITPHETALGGWSAGDIAYYLESGFTPDFDSVGGSMVSVQENLSRLPEEDRSAIAAYLKTVPPIANEPSAE